MFQTISFFLNGLNLPHEAHGTVSWLVSVPSTGLDLAENE